MVTSGQVARGFVRTMRAMDREAKRAERQRLLTHKALHKQALLEASAEAADQYSSVLEALTGAHRIDFQRIDWLTPATSEPLIPPERRDEAERAALALAEGYEPGWFARTFGMEARRRAALSAAVEHARGEDDLDHRAGIAAVDAENARRGFAKRLVDHDPTAVVEALEEHSDLGALPFSIEGLSVRFQDGRMIAVVDGLDLDDMPTESITLLQSGKASVKSIPAGKRLELQRDSICSASVRVALEFLKTLPIAEVEVVMTSDLLDRGSGHIEGEPILYLRVTAQAFSTLNLARTDATALVDRLGGHYDWRLREGFRSINLYAFGISDEAES